jgi:hypothetical protein
MRLIHGVRKLKCPLSVAYFRGHSLQRTAVEVTKEVNGCTRKQGQCTRVVFLKVGEEFPSLSLSLSLFLSGCLLSFEQ